MRESVTCGTVFCSINMAADTRICMGIPVIDLRRELFAKFVNKKALPYLHGVLLAPVRLFS